MKALGQKEQEIMDFLHETVFDPILASSKASKKLKRGVRLTITRLEQLDANGMVNYYWSAIKGTQRSKGFAALMRKEGFEQFEEAIDDFRERFDPRDFAKLNSDAKYRSVPWTNA